jgi:prepilin-type processing-associated H-X9-DG protein
MMIHCRRAASLIELIIVIAISAILLGLLLPAVQKVRNTAARISCANNIKQIALAAHSYHDVEGKLPSPPNVLIGGGRLHKLGWLPMMLPHLEQQPMWNEILADYQTKPRPVLTDTPHRHSSTVMPMFGCPTDDRLTTAWTPSQTASVSPIALTSYLANAGTHWQARDGVVYKGSRTRLDNITDGTTNTLLLGERPPSPDVIYGWWYGGAGILGTGGILDFTLTTRERNLPAEHAWYRACSKGPYHFEARKIDDYCGVYHYWSLHSGGANFGFCDGSVRFLSYSADGILPALSTRSGGEVASAE